MRNWIRFPRVEGTSSRQAHCDLPEGTFERELGREGFFGPSTQMYHRHQPTGWSAWEGPLRPRAFNLNRLDASSGSPWEAHPLQRRELDSEEARPIRILAEYLEPLRILCRELGLAEVDVPP